MTRDTWTVPVAAISRGISLVKRNKPKSVKMTSQNFFCVSFLDVLSASFFVVPVSTTIYNENI